MKMIKTLLLLSVLPLGLALAACDPAPAPSDDNVTYTGNHTAPDDCPGGQSADGNPCK